MLWYNNWENKVRILKEALKIIAKVPKVAEVRTWKTYTEAKVTQREDRIVQEGQWPGKSGRDCRFVLENLQRSEQSFQKVLEIKLLLTRTLCGGSQL